ncbi:Beta-N-acetylhexosaminidase [Saliniradius amylolyticus]|uniref:Beta-N-acetylhexosaminidase n=1 Tax=Saliniradius amylolyticus TaxID=2183582 RepID=A0A2S2E834_9ALTE|nr:DUF1343 domain-containing protein [Saliniradius amylolyticus]AWL13107.1 Beta-N-acetylhexosaminidase [Saliniradius amylolyticus]
MNYAGLFIALLVTTVLSACGQNGQTPAKSGAPEQPEPIVVGAERTQSYLPQLQGKRVGMVVNQTSMVGQQHLVDKLLAEGVEVRRIFAPEHGFRGDHDAGAKVESGVDHKTGIELYSIYGKTRKPEPEALVDLDVILFDIQDVGVRFYTYISSMHYVMEAAAEAGVAFMVLDRPNPNGDYVDGPVLEPEYQSFVGMHPIPLVHGMTVAELAQMIQGEGWLDTDKSLDLTVVPVANYQREMEYPLPVKPSPNLPNYSSIRLYPTLGFFEATPVSIGRGTDFPFQVIGHDKHYVTDAEPAFAFTPRSIPGVSTHPKLEGVKALGMDLRGHKPGSIRLDILLSWYQAFEQAEETFFTRKAWMDKLSGTDKLRLAIVNGKTEQEIRTQWAEGLTRFKRQRQPYLLYP